MKTLSDRKRQVLKLVTESYIERAEPVSSSAIAQKMGGNVSSATIRNELSELTELGYLEQPHTSAGRIPSPKGYRLYVNELMERHELSVQETERINAAMHEKMAQLDDIIAQAGQIVSSFAGYPAYAATTAASDLRPMRYELIYVSAQQFICVLMLSNQKVHSQMLTAALPFEAMHLEGMGKLLNLHFVDIDRRMLGTRLMELSGKMEALLFMLLSAVIEYTQNILESTAHPDVITSGASQILKMPEYQNLERAHELMTFLVDDKEKLPIADSGEPLQILIGPENVSEALRDTSVVIASYDIGDHMRGLVGVVGPTRMDYATVSARLSYFADSLTRMFGKNGLPAVRQEDHENEGEKT